MQDHIIGEYFDSIAQAAEMSLGVSGPVVLLWLSPQDVALLRSKMHVSAGPAGATRDATAPQDSEKKHNLGQKKKSTQIVLI